jgi:hypothetical protein
LQTKIAVPLYGKTTLRLFEPPDDMLPLELLVHVAADIGFQRAKSVARMNRVLIVSQAPY